MAKKKRFKFRVRYLLFLVILFIIYEGWKVFTPVKGYRIKWHSPVEEGKISEVKEVISKPLTKSIEPIRTAIIGLDWVKEVKFHKDLKGEMSIFIQPRVPVARIFDMKDICVDEEGILFTVDDIDTLPIIKVKSDLMDDRLAEAVQILKLTRDMNVEEVEIKSYGLESRIGSIRVLWGRNSYPEKYKFLKKILERGLVSSGKLDFRFDNQVILRR